MWREPSSAPLYATGAEFTWTESGTEQGMTPHPLTKESYDVPLFIDGCRQAMRDAGGVEAFDALPAKEQFEVLFGGENPKGTAPGTTPGARLGRHGSINLRRLTSYGTLEVRRFHGTLDERSLILWAAFCVGFVERFAVDVEARRVCDALLSADDSSAAAALQELQLAQEAATVEMLIDALAGPGGVDAGVIQWLKEDAHT